MKEIMNKIMNKIKSITSSKKFNAGVVAVVVVDFMMLIYKNIKHTLGLSGWLILVGVGLIGALLLVIINWEKINKVWKKNNITSILLTTILVSILGFGSAFVLLSFFGNNVGESEWLGFWGCFIGGLTGGIATLLGVSRTLEKMDEERKERESKDIPFIMPKKLECTIRSNAYNNEKNINSISGNPAKIELINISDRHALEISMDWKKPTFSDIQVVGKINISLNDYQSIKEPEVKDVKENTESLINDMNLYEGIQTLLKLLVDKSNFKKDKDKVSDIPMGNFIFKYKDMFAYRYTTIFSGTAKIVRDTQYSFKVTISYKLINNTREEPIKDK